MAREATARLYDVDQPSLVMKRLTLSGDYDTGEVIFRAKQGTLIDLDRLFESIWATRLSQGTRSGVISLQVTAAGKLSADGNRLLLHVDGYNEPPFALIRDPENKDKDVLAELRSAAEQGKTVVEVSGRIEGWKGRWPTVLNKTPAKPWRMMVTEFKTADQ